MIFLSNSFIINLFIRFLKKISCFYKNSVLFKIIASMAEFFRRALKGSIIIQFFLKDWELQNIWENSILYKLLAIPVKILNGEASKLTGFLDRNLKKSIIIGCIRNFFGSGQILNTRTLGFMAASFVVTETILWTAFKEVNHLFILLNVLLFVISLVFILLNEPLKVIYKKSVIVKRMERFFLNDS